MKHKILLITVSCGLSRDMSYKLKAQGVHLQYVCVMRHAVSAGGLIIFVAVAARRWKIGLPEADIHFLFFSQFCPSKSFYIYLQFHV